MGLLIVDKSKCKKDGICARDCPVDVFERLGGLVYIARREDCITCYLCEVECPKDKDIMALLNYTPRRQKDRGRYKVMLFLLIQTGLRIMEACTLRRDWINFDACEIRVLGKGNKERIVPGGEHVNSYDENYFQSLGEYEWYILLRGWSQYSLKYLLYHLYFKNLFRPFFGKKIVRRGKQIMFHFKGQQNTEPEIA